MRNFRTGLASVLIATMTLVVAARGYGGFATTVPISADSATNIARSLFPVALVAGAGKLFLTAPVVVFVNDRRLGLQVHVQAYEHRPEDGVAISEEGQALVSGELGYDPVTRQVLLYKARLDRLTFDTKSDVTRRIKAEIKAEWASRVTDPVRAEIPPHPFIQPFKDGIQDVTYEKQSIYIQVFYQ